MATPDATPRLPHGCAIVVWQVARIVRAGHSAIVANGNNGEWYLNDGWGNGAVQVRPSNLPLTTPWW